MRVISVKRCNKSPGRCGGCGEPIKNGDPYKWAKGRYTPKKLRCQSCSFRPSELTGSDKLSRLYAARESVEDVLQTFKTADEVRDALEEAAGEAREVASEYQEAADNMAALREDCEEKAGQCESWADALETTDFEDFEEFTGEGDPKKSDPRSEWEEEVKSAVQDALDSLEL
jgi:chromosome segregation ATPase